MWKVFLDRLCDLTSISCGYLVGRYPEEGNRMLAGGGTNFDLGALHLYNLHYRESDPYNVPLFSIPRMGVVSGEDLLDRANLRKTELYNEFLVRYDLEYMNFVICSRNQEQLEGLSLWRSLEQGEVDPASRHLLETLFPHVQTALQLRTKLIAQQSIQVFSEAVLDAMSIAAILVTGTGRICHCNNRGEACLGQNAGLRSRLGKLTTHDLQEAEQLDNLLLAATSNRRNKSKASPGGAMRVSRPAGGPPLQISVVPEPEQNELAGYELCAVVFVTDPCSAPASRATVMRQLYRLTPTECRIADLLIEGLDVREAAERLAITLETARFHLKRVLAKTGARRQTELMRLMLSLPAY